MRSVVVFALALAACVTTPGAPLFSQGQVATSAGATTTVYRWARGHGAVRVLVVPEVGFDHRLMIALCERLQHAGFDVYSLDPRGVAGARDFVLDVASALQASRAELLVATGIGGALAVRATRAASVRGALLVNVPFAFEPSNVALADALAAFGFDPSAWARTPAGPMLLGAGRSTTSAAALAFEKLAVEPGAALRQDVAAFYAQRTRLYPPDIAMRLLVGMKDNLVEPHFALSVRGSANVVAARRMGRIEGFAHDVGHLDWLVDEDVLADVLPVIVEELEALP